MKIKILSALAILIFAFASCKKDYVCQCSVPIPLVGSLNLDTEVINDTKKKAKEQCEAKEDGSVNVSGIPIPIEDVNQTCEILND